MESKNNSLEVKLASQNKVIRYLQKWIFKPNMKKGCAYHLDMHPETKKLISKEEGSVLYVGLHRSLWETGGVNWILNNEGIKSPYIVMGSNLKYTFLSDLFVEKSGIIVFDRDKNANKKELIPKFKTKLQKHLERGDHLIIFAEGTRSRNGLPLHFGGIGFDASIKASENADVYIVPFVVDYSLLRIYELDRYINYIKTGKKEVAQKPKLYEIINFFKGMEDVYVSVGKPKKISPCDNSMDLRKETRNKCLEISKILPANVWATANLYAYNTNTHCRRNVLSLTDKILHNLEGYEHLMRGFDKFDKLRLKYEIEENVKTPYVFGTLNHKAWSELYYNYAKYNMDKIGIKPKLLH